MNILIADVLLVTMLMICLAVLDFLYFVYIKNRGAVYYPTTVQTANKILDLVKLKKGQTIMDLGSGDGVMLIEAGKRGIKAIGYELDPMLVWQSRKKIKELELENLVEIRQENMYSANFNEAEVLYFYQFPKYLAKFEKILEKNLKSKKLVISNRYEFPGRKADWKKRRVFGYLISPTSPRFHYR